MTRKNRTARNASVFTFLAILLSITPLPSQDTMGHKFPRLSNYYLVGEIEQTNVGYFSGWDLHVFNWYVDRDGESRNNLIDIKRNNRDAIFLIYHLSHGVNTTISPPDPLQTFAENYDWWLYDYMGNYLRDMHPWEFNQLINFTNVPAASGNHPNRIRANQYLPHILINNHYDRFDYWSGIFYDVYSDNLQFMYRDIKDATCNLIPEYDSHKNGNEPLFDDIWREGMKTLAENTLRFAEDIYILGNGLHRSSTAFLNGRMQENFRRSSNDFSDLASISEFRNKTERDRAINIIDGIMEDDTFTDFSSMRFAFISSLLLDTYFNSRGSLNGRNQAFWFDEYSVGPHGEIDAVTARLTRSIGETDVTIEVNSTQGFPNSGVLTIAGEQIYYGSKSANAFLNCIRGYPHCSESIASHAAMSTVINYGKSYTGWLGFPLSGAFDFHDPSVSLRSLFEQGGWYANGDLADDINSRIWARVFQGGVAVLNPTSGSVVLNNLGNYGLQKIMGIQDPGHNDGQPVGNFLQIGPKDGYVLIY